MSFFEVRFDELHQLHTRLRDCAERMETTAHELFNADPAHLGTTGLDQACDQLGVRWYYGMNKIADGAQRLSQGVREAQQAYAATEDAIARMCGPGGSTAEGGSHG